MPSKGEVDLRKLKYWKAVLADFERSGLSGPAYCKQKGIPYTAFANRRRKLSSAIAATSKLRAKANATPLAEDRTERSSAKQVGFAEVTIRTSTPAVPTSNGERLELVFPTGIILRIPNGYSAAALAEIITALEVQ